MQSFRLAGVRCMRGGLFLLFFYRFQEFFLSPLSNLRHPRGVIFTVEANHTSMRQLVDITSAPYQCSLPVLITSAHYQCSLPVLITNAHYQCSALGNGQVGILTIYGLWAAPCRGGHCNDGQPCSPPALEFSGSVIQLACVLTS